MSGLMWSKKRTTTQGVHCVSDVVIFRQSDERYHLHEHTLMSSLMRSNSYITLRQAIVCVDNGIFFVKPLCYMHTCPQVPFFVCCRISYLLAYCIYTVLQVRCCSISIKLGGVLELSPKHPSFFSHILSCQPLALLWLICEYKLRQLSLRITLLPRLK